MTDIQQYTDLDDRSLAKAFANSGFFEDSREASQAMVKIVGGREMGIGPMTAMKDLSIVEGKLEMDYPLIARKIRESDKYDYQTVKHTNEKCAIKFVQYDSDGEVIRDQVIEYTVEDALQADLIDDIRDDGTVKARSKHDNKMPWEKHTKNLLIARVMSNAVKWFCPDVTGGSVYHKGEISNAPDISEVDPGDNGQPADTDEEVVDADNVQTEPVEDEGTSAVSEDSTDRPDWADEWLDRDLDTIKSAYDGGDVTADEVASRERQLPEDEQRQEVLAWASTEVDKQQADELNEPQPLG